MTLLVALSWTADDEAMKLALVERTIRGVEAAVREAADVR